MSIEVFVKPLSTQFSNETEYDLHPHSYQVIRRNSQLTPFNANKIKLAITKAFWAVEGDSAHNSERINTIIHHLTQQVVNSILPKLQQQQVIHIEDIQDQVELTLMRAGEHKVARAYVTYRDEHNKQRARIQHKKVIHVLNQQGKRLPLDEEALYTFITDMAQGIQDVAANAIFEESLRNLFDGISEEAVIQTLTISARAHIEREPNYTYLAARFLLKQLQTESLSLQNIQKIITLSVDYSIHFKWGIELAVQHQLLNPQLLTQFDLEQLERTLISEKDLKLTYLGLQTLYDRYLLHWEGKRFELPQAFFMRVAMGLALHEENPTQRAIEFYELLSDFDFMCSTPTLFNSGTLRSQLSSCFISTVPDDLEGIFNGIRDNALLQKWAGGIGNDWTNVRGMGALIKGTNGRSQGVVPFMKVANDTLVSVNQGGRRRGSGCAYLETWHIDIEEFLELRKNTGDDRRRTHDMNTANWVPDLFMERVYENDYWTLFSPDETPNLHSLYGHAFKTVYQHYEQLAAEGKLKLFKKVLAIDLWRKMLTMLFETGHPWITFKDPFNIRSPQQHVGIIHCSNLCTEIGLNTSAEEIAVCNLGSVNLAAHIRGGQLDQEKLKRTVTTAMRMLDNVIDLNYYAVPQAKTANLRHRPVGLGIMGFQDALYQLDISYASQQAIEFADRSMELLSYFAIQASCDLARERGQYPTFEGSLWSQGILPIDSLQLLKQERGPYLEINTEYTLDWAKLRDEVKTVGMRNSNCMAIAPTATISNIVGVSQSIEPTYQNLFVKSNLSGEFIIINPYLVSALKALDLWDAGLFNDLKYHDGSIQTIERIPSHLKELYQTAFEIESHWLIEAAARRQKWLDQSQSLNIYMAQPSGRKLDNLYKLAWIRGLKTTYYLRSSSATHVQKSTLTSVTSSTCQLDDADCEACQ